MRSGLIQIKREEAIEIGDSVEGTVCSIINISIEAMVAIIDNTNPEMKTRMHVPPVWQVSQHNHLH